MLEADKQKLQADLARQKGKNKKLKEKLNELYQAMQKQNSDRFAQIMQHVSTFKREMISLRELLTKTCQNFQKVSDSAEIQELEAQLVLKDAQIERMNAGYDQMLDIQRN